MTRDESGFTIVEVLVAIGLFSLVSVSFYSVMLSGVRGSETSRSLVDISEEARLGFNRIIRDTREAKTLACDPDCPDGDSFNVKVDFNGDGFITARPKANTQGNYEDLLVEFDESDRIITLNGEPLIRGVVKLDPARDVFSYSSNYLEYDYLDENGDPNPNGVTTWEEIDDPPTGVSGVGDRDGVIDQAELLFLSSVNFAFGVESDDRTRISEFYTEAQLRNKR